MVRDLGTGRHLLCCDVSQAVIAIERGRAVLLAEAIQRDRADLARLADHGHADLAQRYRRTAAALAFARGPGGAVSDRTRPA